MNYDSEIIRGYERAIIAYIQSNADGYAYTWEVSEIFEVDFEDTFEMLKQMSEKGMLEYEPVKSGRWSVL